MPTIDAAEIKSHYPPRILLLRGHVEKMFELAPSYPALPRLKSRDLCLQMYFASDPINIWTLYRRADQDYLVRRLRWDTANSPRGSVDPLIYASDALLSGDLVTEHLNELAQISLPVFAETSSPVPDGPVCGFARITGWHRSEFSWCAPLPTEWSLLSNWFHAFSEVVDAHLPAHTDTVRMIAYRPVSTMQ